MHSSPFFSIIVPVYNTDKYLKKCLDSITNQTFQEFEVIVINDASTDKSAEILSTYFSNSKFKIVHLEQNSGPGASRNVGIQAARGKYITFIDSDDWIDNNYLKEHYNYLNQNEVDILSSGLKEVDENGNLIRVDHSPKIIENQEIESALFFMFSDSILKAYAPTKFFKFHLFENFKFKENRLYEDTASIHLLYNYANSFSILNFTSYNYLRHSKSESISNTKSLVSLRDFYFSLDERVTFCLENYPNNQKLLFETCNRAIFMGFQLIFFIFYHQLNEQTLVDYVTKKLKNYPFRKSVLTTKKTNLFYYLLKINTHLFIITLKAFYQFNRKS